MEELSEHEILWNTAALTSLRRQQLMSLSKKYGLKANGKNSEMVSRLYEFGSSLTPASKQELDDVSAQVAAEEPPSPTKPGGMATVLEVKKGTDHLPAPVQALRSMASTRTLGSGQDAWEVLNTSNASLIPEEPASASHDEETGPTSRHWKSAENGGKLSDAGKSTSDLRTVGSLRSLASSIRRTASRTLSVSKRSSPDPLVVFAGVTVEPSDEGSRAADEIEYLPPSPASAIGVAKRHCRSSSDHTLHKRSTIRMVSPTPTNGFELERGASPFPDINPAEELPLTGQNTVEKIKKRRSAAPMAGSQPPMVIPDTLFPSHLSPGVPQASVPKLYPGLPSPRHQDLPKSNLDGSQARSPSPEIPGSFPKQTSPSFVFGSGQGVNFSDAGAQLLQEMQAKMGGTGTFNVELLKGKSAEMSKLVAINKDVGSGSGPRGGWGLSSGPSDRYAAAHQREFSRMKSLSSLTSRPNDSSPNNKRKYASASVSGKANGLPIAPTVTPDEQTDLETDRAQKRSKHATAKYLGPLRLTRSTTGEGLEIRGTPSPRKKSSLKPESKLRFAFLRQRKMAETEKANNPDSTRVEQPTELPQSGVDKGSTTPPDLAQASTSTIPSSGRLPVSSGSVSGLSAASRSTASSSVKNVTTATSGKIPSLARQQNIRSGSTSSRRSLQRAPIPDFGPPVVRQPVKSDSSNSLAKSRVASSATSSTSSSLARSTRSHELHRMASGTLRPSSSGIPVSTFKSGTARKASSDHLAARKSSRDSSDSSIGTSSIGSTRPGTMSRSSTSASLPRSKSSLLAPTAASLARMQATVKPPQEASTSASGTATVRRPLPKPPTKAGVPSGLMSPGGCAPQIPTVKPFGEAASRANHLFESNFQIGPLANDPSKVGNNIVSAPRGPTEAATKRFKDHLKSPSKGGSAPVMSPSKARSRARASGVAGMKARGNIDDADVGRRRAEMRAKQERLTQERELRNLLG